MKRPVAISRICALSREGWAPKSKPLRSRTKGKRARPKDMPIRRWSRRGALALAKKRQRLPHRQPAGVGLVDQAVELIAQRLSFNRLSKAVR